MYVDASTACNNLNFIFGNTGIGASIATTRSWSVRITQYSCNYPNLAPSGCTEYFYGNDNGLITSYNYAGGIHLANQRQMSCIRKEKGNCKICYSTVDATTDFGISGYSS